jgi:ADP-heptose:LPS heptosyltransferase
VNISWMRWIDHKVGNVVCSAFAVAKQVQAPFTTKPKTIKKIAVMKFFGMGSIVVSSPSLKALRDAYPNAEIIFVTFKANKEILSILGLTDRNIFIDNSSLKKFTKSTAEAAYQLWREKIDLAIDFEFFAKFPLVLSSLANVPMKAGFHLTLEPWRRTLLDVKGYYNHYFHTKDIFLSLVYLLTTNDLYYVDFDAFRAKYNYPKVTVGDAEKKKVDEVLAKHGYRPGQRLILMNANAAAELAPEIRKWPEERYSELARRIRAEYEDAFVAFVGAPSEKEYTDRLAKAAHHKDIVSLAGTLSIRELIAIIEKAQVFITNDSGPMHLACLVDVPIVGLFFAETPVLFAPLAEKAVSISPNLYSIPLFTVYTGKKIIADENVASRTVTVDRVLDKVKELLTATGVGRAASSIN